MKKLAVGILCAGFFFVMGCGGDEHTHITLDAGSNSGTCDPLKQTGCGANEKCTWLLDAIAPNYVGHVGCAPAGTVAAGEPCKYGGQGTDGYDNCAKGLVCGGGWSPIRGGQCTGGTRACTKDSECNPGEDCRRDAGFCGKRCIADSDCDAGATCDYFLSPICKTICDPLSGTGNATCDSGHACKVYSALFSTGDTTPAAAGACDTKCNPNVDNDYDGSGALTRTGTACGASEGCYGSPDRGMEPPTRWTCTADFNKFVAQPTGLRHRVECTEGNRCLDTGQTAAAQNSCNQGYLPLFRETSSITTTICVAICEPQSCYQGNCGGTQDINRLGKAGNRCNTNDRIGTFNLDSATTPHPNGEQCQFLWSREIDSMSGMYVPSELKDAVGFCFDHSQYPYDSNNDGSLDATLPACAAVPIHNTGSDLADPLTYFGAADMGCVTSDEAGVNMADGKPHKILAAMLEKMRHIDMPRPLYHRYADYQ